MGHVASRKAEKARAGLRIVHVEVMGTGWQGCFCGSWG